MRANTGKSIALEGTERVAAEVLRALRGPRSQRAFARRLGYRANPITDWENGRRFPTAVEALRAARLVGVDVRSAFSAFHAAPPPEDSADGLLLAPWLSAICGTTPVAHVAARAGYSRFAVGRWLKNLAKPRLPDFFRCVDAMTGRLPDLVAALVPIEEVPSLLSRYENMRAARRLAYDAPWTEGVLRSLETEEYRALPAHVEGFIASRLGMPLAAERDALRRLEAASVIRLENGLWCQHGALSVDTRGTPDDLSVLLRHWTAVSYRRIAERRRRDLFAYNVMSVSRADYEIVRDLLRRTFREVQSIVAASSPSERVALLSLQLLEFDALPPPAEPK